MGMLPPSSSEAESQWPPLSTRWCWRNALIQDVRDLRTRGELGGMAVTPSLRFPTLLPCFSRANTQQGHIQKCPDLLSLRGHCWPLSLAFQSWLSLNITKKQTERSPVTWRRKKSVNLILWDVLCQHGEEGTGRTPACDILNCPCLEYVGMKQAVPHITWYKMEPNSFKLLRRSSRRLVIKPGTNLSVLQDWCFKTCRR